jgi:hypothetical protein
LNFFTAAGLSGCRSQGNILNGPIKQGKLVVPPVDEKTKPVVRPSTGLSLTAELLQADGTPMGGAKVLLGAGDFSAQSSTNGQFEIPVEKINSNVLSLKIYPPIESAPLNLFYTEQSIVADIVLPADLLAAVSSARVSQGATAIVTSSALTAQDGSTADASAEHLAMRKLALQVPENVNATAVSADAAGGAEEKQSLLVASIPLAASETTKSVGMWTTLFNESNNDSVRFRWDNSLAQDSLVRIVFSTTENALSGWDGSAESAPAWPNAASGANLVTDVSGCTETAALGSASGALTGVGNNKCGFFRNQFPFTDAGVIYFRAVAESQSEIKLSPTFAFSGNAKAPVLSALQDQNILLNGSVTDLPVRLEDPDSQLTCGTALSARSTNLSLVPNKNMSWSGRVPNCLLSLFPVKGVLGNTKINVVATDGSYTDTKSFLLSVDAKNEPPTVAYIRERTTNEDTPTVPVMITINDTDGPVQTCSSSFLSYTSSNTAVVSAQAAVRWGGTWPNCNAIVTPELNASGDTTIAFSVSDGTSTSLPQPFVLKVAAVNDAPLMTAIENQTINEDTSTSALSFSISDVDDAVRCEQVKAASGNTDLLANANILIAGGSGASCSVVATPSANKSGSVVITLSLSDRTGSDALTAVRSFTLNVLSVKDPITISDVPDQTVVEDTALNPVSFVIADNDQNLTGPCSTWVSATSSDAVLVPLGNVSVSGAAPNCSVTVLPDKDQSGRFSTIRLIFNNGKESVFDDFVLSVTAVNDAPTMTALADAVINEDESTGALGFIIGDVDNMVQCSQVNASSSDTNLIPNSGSNLIVAGGSGKGCSITVVPAANKAGTATVTLSLNDVSGAGNSIVGRSFSVTVKSVNDAPTSTDVVISADEDKPQVLALSDFGTYSDVETPTLQAVKITSLADASIGVLKLGGQRVLANSFITASQISNGGLVFEPALNANGRAVVGFQVSDGTDTSLSTYTLSINVNPVNDSPTDIALTATSLDENRAAGEIVGTFSSTDVDAGNSFTYALSGSDAGVFTVVGNGLKTAASFDFEAKRSYTITVTTTDQGALSFSKNFTITVNDMNEAPTDIALSASSIDENMPSASVVGLFSTVDADSGNMFTYSLGGVDAGFFSLVGNTLKTTASFDFEAKSAYAITVTATDQGSLSLTKNFTITVRNVNEAPTDILLSVLSVNENTTGGSAVGTLSATDVDAGNSFSYSLSGSDSSSFIIEGNSLKTAAVLDFETKSSFAITVTTTDQGALSFSKNFIITVNDVNEAPTDIALSASSIDENLPAGATIGMFTSNDADMGNTFTYSLSGPDAASFYVAGNTLKSAVSFDFEGKSSYAITVTTTDQDSLTFSKNFTVAVNDVIEAATDITLSATSVDENMAIGSTVGTLSAITSDSGSLFSFSLSGADSALFSISGNLLKTAGSLNFEAKSSYAITVTTTNQSGLTFSKNFIIIVNDVNEAPTDITLSAASINENMASGSTVGTLSSTDVDASNTFAYSLSGADSASFSITGNTLKTAAGFNFEAKSSYAITVTTTDQGSLTFTKNFTITVNNVNEAPTDVTLSATSINENLTSGSTVGTLTSTDPDTGNTFSYSLSGTDAASFSITGSTLKTAASFNFEAKSSYSIAVTTTDQGSLTFSKNFTITVNDVNEAPIDVTLTAISINENMASGSVVGTLSSTDVDAGNTFTYSVGGTDAALFAISSGMLVTAASFNYETKSSYSITLTTADQGSLAFTKNFTISVNDVNEAPTDITLSAASINENMATGSTVGNLTSTDPDTGNTFSYSLSGTDASSFSITGSTLKTTASFNFEAKSSYSIGVTTTDQGGLTFNKNFTITVNDVNESPTNITLSSASINENMVSGSTVGTLSTTDVDTGTTFAYSLSGTDAASFSITGNTLKTAASFNFEAKSSYAITVTSTDQGGLPFTKNFTISVNNVNEAPTDITLSATSINENMVSGSTLGTLTSTDPDSGNTFSYSLSGTDAASFSITGSTLMTAASFNFEAKSSFSITVTTTDQGSLTFTKNFTITVNDVNEAPTDITLSATSINENMSIGSAVGTLSSIDPDTSNSWTYSVGGADSSSFSITGTALNTAASFNFESKNSYSITITSSDQGNQSYTKSFTIIVNDINEKPVLVGGNSSKMTAEDTAASVTLASASDPDAGNTMTYSILTSPTNGTLGSLPSNPAVGGNLTYTPSANFNGSDSFTYTVCDNLNLCATSQTVTISISAVNDVPTISTVSGTTTINEDTNTAALSFTIADVDSTVLCSQVTATSSNTTLIPNANLVIAGGGTTSCSITATPAANQNGSAILTLSLTDSSSANTTRSFAVTVNPVNDTPTMNAISNQTVNMSNSINVSFTVGDVDGLSDISCSAANLSYSSSTTSIVPATGALSWSGTAPNCVGQITPTTSQFGVLNITFQIQDAAATTASRTFQLTVNDTRAATAPTITGDANVPSNVTNFDLSGTCTANYTVALSGDVSATDVSSPAQSLTQTCPSNGNYSYTIVKTVDGSYVFRVAQTNPLQLPSPVQSAAASQIWTRDTVPPATITITNPTVNPTSSRSGTFTFMGTCEASATIEVTTTVVPNTITVPTATTTCSTSGTFSIAQNLGAEADTTSDGTYTYSFKETDRAGNVTPMPGTFKWTKDSNIPTTPVISSPTPITGGYYYTNGSNPTSYPLITVSCTGANDVTINENGSLLVSGTCAASTYSYQTPSRGDGSYLFEISQTDTTSGLVSAVASFTWVRDTGVPSAPIFSSPVGGTSITAPTKLYLVGTCESAATVHIYFAGSLETSTTCAGGSFATSVTRSGALANYSITAKQQDAAGNLSPASLTVTWTQDPNSAPIPYVTSPSGGIKTGNATALTILGICQPGYNVTIAAGSGTTLSSGDITSPAGAFTQSCAADGSFAYTISKTVDGAYNFNLTQQLSGGGVNSAPAAVSWTRDTTPPTVTITPDTSGANAYSGTAIFTLTASETVIGYQCSTDNITFATCTSPYVYSFASATNPAASNNIQKTVWVRATDSAQNTGAAASRSWTPTIYNTALLYHFDSITSNSTSNSSSYSASVASSMTTSGTGTAAGKFSNGLNFGTTANTATLTDNALLSAFLSTATIEFWFQSSTSASATIMAHQVSASSGLSWSISKTKVNNNTYSISFGGSINGTSLTNISGSGSCSISKNTLRHIAVTFDRGSVTLYCNGTSGGSGIIGTSGSARLFDSSGSLVLGGGVYLIDELRISQGIRYTTTFTPSAAAFVAD